MFGHVNFSSLKRLRNMRLIPNVNTKNYSKSHVCVEVKFAKKPFKKSVTSKENRIVGTCTLRLSRL